MIVDYHMHLRDEEERIDHTVEAVELWAEEAGARGVDEIGFTEHVYYFRQTRELWTIPYQVERCVYDLDSYCDAIVEAKRRGLPVKLGLEVDYVLGREEETAARLEPYPWDFLLGSIHYVDGIQVDGPQLTDALPPAEAWRLYFEWLRSAAGSGLFDALSHPDLVKFLGVRPDPATISLVHEEAADAIAAGGVCVEISAAGLHKPVGELYPDPELLAACRQRGVSITLASDAHRPHQVGRDLDRAVALARDTGYDTVTVFDERKRRQEPLG